MPAPVRWDIFCRVVDHFGDAGVCWRLARQLADEHALDVCLWIDDVETLQRLVPAVESRQPWQRVEGVTIRQWKKPLEPFALAHVVIDAFGCGVPDEYVNAMSAVDVAPLWIVLEYLSAEKWVATHHALSSPHPATGLERHFFFPGFTPNTGGLLREHDLLERRARFTSSDAAQLWRELDHAPPPSDACVVSMFAYDHAPLLALIGCWMTAAQRTVMVIAQGSAVIDALDSRYCSYTTGERVIQCGQLEIRVVPFLAQRRYDELLWACDINFVRGEDSFVRAQWAARPFVWHCYRQEARAHVPKLEAFIDLYSIGLPEPARSAACNLMRSWNGLDVPGCSLAAAWHDFTANTPVLRRHAEARVAELCAPGDLALNLARFAGGKLK